MGLAWSATFRILTFISSAVTFGFAVALQFNRDPNNPKTNWLFMATWIAAVVTIALAALALIGGYSCGPTVCTGATAAAASTPAGVTVTKAT